MLSKNFFLVRVYNIYSVFRVDYWSVFICIESPVLQKRWNCWRSLSFLVNFLSFFWNEKLVIILIYHTIYSIHGYFLRYVGIWTSIIYIGAHGPIFFVFYGFPYIFFKESVDKVFSFVKYIFYLITRLLFFLCLHEFLPNFVLN